MEFCVKIKIFFNHFFNDMKALFSTDKKSLFETEILIQVSDINYGGHLGNDRFLILAQEARARYFQSMGWKENNISGSHVGIVVRQAEIQFHNEAFLGDVIVVKIWVENISKCSFDMNFTYDLKGVDKHVGRVKSQLVFFDYKIRKIAICPKGFKESVELGT